MSTYDQLGRLVPSKDFFYERGNDELLDEGLNIQQKAALLRVSACVVAIISPNVSAEMTKYLGGMRMMNTSNNQIFKGSGTVIECEVGGDGKFLSTIITTSTLFTRTNGVQPANIEVEVYLVDGKIYKAEVLACDFHYNLAALRIQSDTPIQVANLRGLDDVMSIDQAEQHQLSNEDSSLFKIHPQDMVIILGRYPPDSVPGPCRLFFSAGGGGFSVEYSKLDCKELYSLDIDHEGDSGGPAINCHGDVIGIMVCDNYFLPSNIVSRWWKHYKQYRNFCRPWLGVKVANLHSASVYFLEPFVQKFPNISTGVIVTKVAEDSLAYSSGLRSQDVIVQCDGESVRSILEFVENIWDKAGGTVEFSILRLSNGERLKLTTAIDETTPDKFYRWPIPDWCSRPEKRSRIVSDSESSDAE